MIRLNKFCAFRISFFAIVLLAITGCSAPSNVAYFQDMPLEKEVSVVKPTEVIFKAGDQINILVSTRDAALSSIFSKYSTYTVGEGRGAFGGRESQYVIDADGTIDFPVLGRIPVAGKTRTELELYIKKTIQDQNLVKDPVITVTFDNLYVTVIGSTGHVGRINIDRDNFTLLDAIAQAGDLQLTGLRENVRVIREVGIDKLISYEVNFCSAEDLYNSPVYYLQQKDVIYVEPSNKVKRTTTQYGTQVVNYTFWFSLISSTLGMIALFRR